MKLPSLVRVMAAKVPSTTLIVAVVAAIQVLSHALDMTWVFSNNSLYHLVEKPPHIVTNFDSLNDI